MGRDSDVPGDEEGSGSVEGRHSEDKTGGGRNGSASKKHKDKYGPGSVPDGYDVDHVIDLQLGGIDHVCNMRPSMPALIGAWEPDTLSDKGSSRRH